MTPTESHFTHNGFSLGIQTSRDKAPLYAGVHCYVRLHVVRDLSVFPAMPSGLFHALHCNGKHTYLQKWNLQIQAHLIYKGLIDMFWKYIMHLFNIQESNLCCTF